MLQVQPQKDKRGKKKKKKKKKEGATRSRGLCSDRAERCVKTFLFRYLTKVFSFMLTVHGLVAKKRKEKRGKKKKKEVAQRSWGHCSDRQVRRVVCKKGPLGRVACPPRDHL